MGWVALVSRFERFKTNELFQGKIPGTSLRQRAPSASSPMEASCPSVTIVVWWLMSCSCVVCSSTNPGGSVHAAAPAAVAGPKVCTSCRRLSRRVTDEAESSMDATHSFPIGDGEVVAWTHLTMRSERSRMSQMTLSIAHVRHVAEDDEGLCELLPWIDLAGLLVFIGSRPIEPDTISLAASPRAPSLSPPTGRRRRVGKGVHPTLYSLAPSSSDFCSNSRIALCVLRVAVVVVAGAPSGFAAVDYSPQVHLNKIKSSPFLPPVVLPSHLFTICRWDFTTSALDMVDA